MTVARSRKTAIRARMAATGEPFSVAARRLVNRPPPQAAVPGPPTRPGGSVLGSRSQWLALTALLLESVDRSANSRR
jgi:hypothetical protein